MSFFKQFPNLEYDLRNNNVLINAKDIFRHVDTNDALADDVLTYTYYEVIEGERPDTVSQRLYGTPDYYWTFFLVDDAMKEGLKSWPRDPLTLDRELQLEFNEVGAIVLVPTIKQFQQIYSHDGSQNQYDKENVGATSLNGVNCTYPQLRIKRNNKYARLLKWDNDLLQLQLTHFSDSPKGPHSSTAKTTFFTGDHDITLSFAEGDNASPVDSPRYDFIKSLATALTRSFTDYSPDYLTEYGGSPLGRLHEDALSYYSSPDNYLHRGEDEGVGGDLGAAIQVFDSNGRSALQDVYTFSPAAQLRTYSDFREAPAYYYADNSPDQVISAYDAFNIPTQDSPLAVVTNTVIGEAFAGVGPDIFVTNVQNEINKNEKRSRIKVVRPENIEAFVDAYKTLINS